MKSLLKKVRGDKKGFTLAELLVVVAIIGILVAISVPVFTAQLGKARRATNNANLRAAKAAAVAEYLSDEDTRSSENGNTTAYYLYTVESGVVTKSDKSAFEAATAVTINKTEGSDKVSDTATYKGVYVKIGTSSDNVVTDTVELSAVETIPTGSGS